MVVISPPARRRRWVSWLVLALIGSGVLLWWWRPWAATDAPPPALRTAKVVMGDVENSVSALGTLEALQYVDVGTQVSGQIQKIYVAIGDVVKQGDLLAEIDPTLYWARVSADQAQLAVLQAQITEKEAQRILAEQQLKRQQMLMNARATSQDLYESAVATLKALEAQIEALKAQMRQVEANLRADESNLGYTKIYAPMAGTVVDLSARQGQTVNAVQMAPTIMRVADLSTMKVNAQVSEADVTKLKVGMPAYFITLGRPDRRLDGKLRQIMPTPTVTNNVVLYNVVFDVANQDGELLPQMSAQVSFVLSEVRNVPTVPLAALIPLGPPGKFGALVLKDGRPERREVSIGVSNRVVAEVKSGLQVGDVLLLPPPGPGGPRPPGGPPL